MLSAYLSEESSSLGSNPGGLDEPEVGRAAERTVADCLDPTKGTPEFDTYMQALQPNGFNLNPDTAWRVANQACEGGSPGFLGYELIAQESWAPGRNSG